MEELNPLIDIHKKMNNHESVTEDHLNKAFAEAEKKLLHKFKDWDPERKEVLKERLQRLKEEWEDNLEVLNGEHTDEKNKILTQSDELLIELSNELYKESVESSDDNFLKKLRLQKARKWVSKQLDSETGVIKDYEDIWNWSSDNSVNAPRSYATGYLTALKSEEPERGKGLASETLDTLVNLMDKGFMSWADKSLELDDMTEEFGWENNVKDLKARKLGLAGESIGFVLGYLKINQEMKNLQGEPISEEMKEAYADYIFSELENHKDDFRGYKGIPDAANRADEDDLDAKEDRELGKYQSQFLQLVKSPKEWSKPFYERFEEYKALFKGLKKANVNFGNNESTLKAIIEKKPEGYSPSDEEQLVAAFNGEKKAVIEYFNTWKNELLKKEKTLESRFESIIVKNNQFAPPRISLEKLNTNKARLRSYSIALSYDAFSEDHSLDMLMLRHNSFNKQIKEGLDSFNTECDAYEKTLDEPDLEKFYTSYDIELTKALTRARDVKNSVDPTVKAAAEAFEGELSALETIDALKKNTTLTAENLLAKIQAIQEKSANFEKKIAAIGTPNPKEAPQTKEAQQEGQPQQPTEAQKTEQSTQAKQGVPGHTIDKEAKTTSAIGAAVASQAPAVASQVPGVEPLAKAAAGVAAGIGAETISYDPYKEQWNQKQEIPNPFPAGTEKLRVKLSIKNPPLNVRSEADGSVIHTLQPGAEIVPNMQRKALQVHGAAFVEVSFIGADAKTVNGFTSASALEIVPSGVQSGTQKEQAADNLQEIKPEYKDLIAQISTYGERPEGMKFDLPAGKDVIRCSLIKAGSYYMVLWESSPTNSLPGGKMTYGSLEEVKMAINNTNLQQMITTDRTLRTYTKYERYQHTIGRIKDNTFTVGGEITYWPSVTRMALEWDDQNAFVSVQAMPFGGIEFTVEGEAMNFDGKKTYTGFAPNFGIFMEKLAELKNYMKKGLSENTAQKELFTQISDPRSYSPAGLEKIGLQGSDIGQMLDFKVFNNHEHNADLQYFHDTIEVYFNWSNRAIADTQVNPMLHTWVNKDGTLSYILNFNGKNKVEKGSGKSLKDVIEKVMKIRTQI